jgi:replicative DNA helicase
MVSRPPCKRRHGSCGLAVIDYLQLVASAGKSENRQTEVAGISRALKVAAKDLDIPIVVLAQLNRGPEGEKRAPRPSDLRESGAVEQDADVVILLHRDEEDDAGTLHVGVGKNRHGPKGAFTLQWQGHYSRLMPDDWSRPSNPMFGGEWSPTDVLDRAS